MGKLSCWKSRQGSQCDFKRLQWPLQTVLKSWTHNTHTHTHMRLCAWMRAHARTHTHTHTHTLRKGGAVRQTLGETEKTVRTKSATLTQPCFYHTLLKVSVHLNKSHAYWWCKGQRFSASSPSLAHLIRMFVHNDQHWQVFYTSTVDWKSDLGSGLHYGK